VGGWRRGRSNRDNQSDGDLELNGRGLDELVWRL